MAQYYLFGFLMVLSCVLLEVSPRPSNNEPTTSVNIESLEEPTNIDNASDKEERSLVYNPIDSELPNEATKEILEKIQAINEALKKPHRRQQMKWPKPQVPTDGGYTLDKDILEKLQQVIASGKLHPHHEALRQQENNLISDDNLNLMRQNRQLQELLAMTQGMQAIPIPYIASRQQESNLISDDNSNLMRQNRQMQQRLAMNQVMQFMPIPYIASRQQESNLMSDDNSNLMMQNRQMQQLLAMNQVMQAMPIPYLMSMPVLVMPSLNNMHNGFPTNKINSESGSYQTRQSSAPSSSFQWPFAQFFPLLIKDPFLSVFSGAGWNNLIEYGQNADVCSRKQKHTENQYLENDITENKQYIKSNILNLSDPVKSNKSRQKRSIKKRTILHSSASQSLENTKKEKTIFVNKTRKPVKQTTVAPQLDQKFHSANIEEAEEAGDLRFPFSDFTLFGNRKPVAPSPGFFINRLKVRRGGVAIAGPGGVATAGRGGTAIVGPGGLAYTQPGGVAVAGPAARVIALSEDANLSSIVSRLQKQSAIDGSVPQLLKAIPEGKIVATGPVIYHHPLEQQSIQYLPFYGGAKGQYLEVKKDTSGTVTSEKIVSEEKVSSENVVKNNDENLLGKVLAANLQNLRSISNNLLKLQNIGRKTGYLGNAEKIRFRTQLASLGEAASNTIKLLEDVGDNVDMLFKKNVTQRRFGQPDEDYILEEGIGIEAQESYPDDDKKGPTIAEAKPVGLAIIGEHGVAASRPVATAVAASGYAIARPSATAIAGFNPEALGINYNNYQAQR